MVIDAERFRRIDRAFKSGDLEALRAAVEDPALVPNGYLGLGIGSCLVYAVYHSPLAFVRQLLESGANPNEPVDDGFPPIIAALSCARAEPGAGRRTDVDDILRLLLSFGADPNQRGVNDYTPLHMAVAEGNISAIRILLDGGADPALRTRIDDYETPVELAERAGHAGIAAMLDPKRQPAPRRLRAGLMLLADLPGTGELLRRQQHVRVRLRLWTKDGAPVRWQQPPGEAGDRLEDDGATLLTRIQVARSAVINGLFYGVDGMRIGGTRRLEIAPHLAYGDRGLEGVISPGATLIAEITILEVCDPTPRRSHV